MASQTSESGFTLVECIVALLLFVSSYLLIRETLVLGWRGVGIAHTKATALLLAQSSIAAEGIEAPLEPGSRLDTTSDGFNRRIDVTLQKTDTSPASNALFNTYRINVEIMWSDRLTRRQRTLQLTTLKLARRQ